MPVLAQMIEDNVTEERAYLCFTVNTPLFSHHSLNILKQQDINNSTLGWQIIAGIHPYVLDNINELHKYWPVALADLLELLCNETGEQRSHTASSHWRFWKTCHPNINVVGRLVEVQQLFGQGSIPQNIS